MKINFWLIIFEGKIKIENRGLLKILIYIWKSNSFSKTMIHPFYKANQKSELRHWFFNNELPKNEKNLFLFLLLVEKNKWTESRCIAIITKDHIWHSPLTTYTMLSILSCITSRNGQNLFKNLAQNGQIHFKNLAGNAARIFF